MKIALISDIHANLPALEAVLEDIDRQQPDAVYCLGDLVGYAPWPNEVIALIRKRRIATISGNHDQRVGWLEQALTTEAGDSIGKQSMAYTTQELGGAERRYLRDLPARLTLHFELGATRLNVGLAHGSLRSVDEYLFADHPEVDLLSMMEQFGVDLLFFGHTHLPYHRKLAYEQEGITHYRHAINVGSVGKPKDGNPKACYVLLHLDANYDPLDADSLVVQFIRVDYEVERSARAIESSPLPDAFADMLRKAY